MLKDEFLELRRRIIAKDFERMNDRQQEAIYAVNGPLLLLAGAGSGKTTVLVNRIANLIKYGNAYQQGGFGAEGQTCRKARRRRKRYLGEHVPLLLCKNTETLRRPYRLHKPLHNL